MASHLLAMFPTSVNCVICCCDCHIDICTEFSPLLIYRFVDQRTMEGSFQLNPNASPFIPGSLSSFAGKAPENQAGETKINFLMALQVFYTQIWFIHMTTVRAETSLTFFQSHHERVTLLVTPLILRSLRKMTWIHLL